MKKLLIAGVAGLAMSASALVLDGIAAKVNDNVITIGDVMAEMKRNRPDLEKGLEFRDIYSNTVERLIDRRLILKVAADKKLDMQEWMVDNRIREIVKESFEGDRNKLQLMLDQSKVTMTDWRNEIRDDMIIQATRYQVVDKNVTATPAAMRREFEHHPERYRREAKVSVRVILLRPAEDAKTPSLTTRGEEILAKLEKGADFAALAREHSADSRAKDGGLWKDVKPEDAFRPEVAAAIAKLKPGETSELIALDGWGFIVRKEDESAAKNLSFAEAYTDIERNVKRELGRAEYAAWMRRLRAQAFVKVYPVEDR